MWDVVASTYSVFKTEFPDGSNVVFEGSLWTDERMGHFFYPRNVVWKQDDEDGDTSYWVPGSQAGSPDGWWPVPSGLVVIRAEDIDGRVWDDRLECTLMTADSPIHF